MNSLSSGRRRIRRKISEAKSAGEAYSKIAAAKAKFFSRGDNSGTHKKELEVWQKSGISPSGEWYLVTKDFMTATLKRANDEKGYFMTDSSTWVAEQKNVPGLRFFFGETSFWSTHTTRFVNRMAQHPGQPRLRSSSIL